MTDLWNSWQNEADIEDIERNNLICSKKWSNFKQKQVEIDREIGLLEVCNLQIRKMCSVSDAKTNGVSGEVEALKLKVERFIRDSAVMLDGNSQTSGVLDPSQLSLPAEQSLTISLPYDGCILNLVRKQEDIEQAKTNEMKTDELAKERREKVAMLQRASLKAKSKVEKEATMLREEIRKQKESVTSLQKSNASTERKVDEASKTLEKESRIEEDIVKEIENFKKRGNELKESNVLENELHGTIKKDLRLFNKLSSGLKDRSDIDINEVSHCKEILQYYNNWRKLPSFSQENSNSVSVKNLQVSLESVTKQATKTMESIGQMDEYSTKYAVTKETLTRKRSGYWDVKKQIVDNTTILDGLKVTDRSVRPLEYDKQKKKEEIFRQLEATRNDVPQNRSFKPYETPTKLVKTVSNPGLWDEKILKRTSITADSTRPMSSNGPQYPGIELVHRKETTEPKKDPDESDYFNDSSSLLNDVSGSTGNDSALFKFFSPLKNESPVPQQAIDFSMADHMKDFNQRQAEKKSAAVVQKLSSGRTDADSDNEANFSIIAPQEDDEDEGGDSDDDDVTEYDDLIAKGDSEYLNQSVWDDDD